jgi:hypothetical protein
LLLLLLLLLLYYSLPTIRSDDGADPYSYDGYSSSSEGEGEEGGNYTVMMQQDGSRTGMQRTAT